MRMRYDTNNNVQNAAENTNKLSRLVVKIRADEMSDAFRE